MKILIQSLYIIQPIKIHDSELVHSNLDIDIRYTYILRLTHEWIILFMNLQCLLDCGIFSLTAEIDRISKSNLDSEYKIVYYHICTYIHILLHSQTWKN